MPGYRHCRHCWGDCGGGCLLDHDTGLCIHNVDTQMRRQVRARRRRNRAWLRILQFGRQQR